ncbi:MAG: hemerythrin domain-containing protein [Rhodospirillales bacterium]|nr:hemerythrin domain-containing protein [Rhodospirillales bacterium]
MSEVIRVLRREHANMASLVKTLDAQVAEFEKGNKPDYEVIRSAIDYFLSFPDLYHHPKEDLIYARLVERDPETARKIGDLRSEHERLAAQTKKFSAGVTAILDDAQVPRESFVMWAHDFIHLQMAHMRMEEELFFPAALSALSEEDWAALEQEMTSEDDPLFGENVGARFETLRKNILRWEKDA